jgi:pyrroline-5-carboxylate reductase
MTSPASPLDGLTVAFIGAGNMATAIATGLVAKGVVPPERIRAASPSGGNDRLRALGVTCTSSNADAAKGADIVVLSVKPWVMAPAIASIRDALQSSHNATIVSVAAGTSIEQIESSLSPHSAASQDWRIVRVMPNTPCSVGVGASAMCLGRLASAADAARVRALFSAVSTVETVTEPQLDAVTGLSGSGPAYVFMFIEALADGGVASGLPRPVAMALAAQLVRGASTMLQETGRHPGELKDAVASPGGTTIAGIHALETAGFRGAVMSAVLAGTKRCAELRNGK